MNKKQKRILDEVKEHMKKEIKRSSLYFKYRKEGLSDEEAQKKVFEDVQ